MATSSFQRCTQFISGIQTLLSALQVIWHALQKQTGGRQLGREFVRERQRRMPRQWARFAAEQWQTVGSTDRSSLSQRKLDTAMRNARKLALTGKQRACSFFKLDFQ
jgi:ribosomal protein S18